MDRWLERDLEAGADLPPVDCGRPVHVWSMQRTEHCAPARRARVSASCTVDRCGRSADSLRSATNSRRVPCATYHVTPANVERQPLAALPSATGVEYPMNVSTAPNGCVATSSAADPPLRSSGVPTRDDARQLRSDRSTSGAPSLHRGTLNVTANWWPRLPLASSSPGVAHAEPEGSEGARAVEGVGMQLASFTSASNRSLSATTPTLRQAVAWPSPSTCARQAGHRANGDDVGRFRCRCDQHRRQHPRR